MFMKKKTHRAYLVLAPVAALLLTACSSEPSSSDMKAALEPELKQMLEIQANMANAFTKRAGTTLLLFAPLSTMTISTSQR